SVCAWLGEDSNRPASRETIESTSGGDDGWQRLVLLCQPLTARWLRPPDRALLVIADLGVVDALALGVTAQRIALFLRDAVVGFHLFVLGRRHRILRLPVGLGVFLGLGKIRLRFLDADVLVIARLGVTGGLGRLVLGLGAGNGRLVLGLVRRLG